MSIFFSFFLFAFLFPLYITAGVLGTGLDGESLSLLPPSAKPRTVHECITLTMHDSAVPDAHAMDELDDDDNNHGGE
jgi:hypothetical protein